MIILMLNVHFSKTQADDKFYVVLSLRTCPQGRPLLPAAIPQEPAEQGEDPWFVLLDALDMNVLEADQIQKELL